MGLRQRQRYSTMAVRFPVSDTYMEGWREMGFLKDATYIQSPTYPCAPVFQSLTGPGAHPCDRASGPRIAHPMIEPCVSVRQCVCAQDVDYYGIMLLMWVWDRFPNQHGILFFVCARGHFSDTTALWNEQREHIAGESRFPEYAESNEAVKRGRASTKKRIIGRSSTRQKNERRETQRQASHNVTISQLSLNH